MRAPSTLGTFLRSFTWGHVAQLDRVLDESIRRSWQAGADRAGAGHFLLPCTILSVPAVSQGDCSGPRDG